jgi:hypothetical protein
MAFVEDYLQSAVCEMLEKRYPQAKGVLPGDVVDFSDFVEDAIRKTEERLVERKFEPRRVTPRLTLLETDTYTESETVGEDEKIAVFRAGRWFANVTTIVSTGTYTLYIDGTDTDPEGSETPTWTTVVTETLLSVREYTARITWQYKYARVRLVIGGDDPSIEVSVSLKDASLEHIVFDKACVNLCDMLGFGDEESASYNARAAYHEKQFDGAFDAVVFQYDADDTGEIELGEELKSPGAVKLSMS